MTTQPVTIRPLALDDREAWEPLWKGYQTFYKVAIPPEVTDLTWQRFHDDAEPMYALGAFQGEQLLGIVHYLFHRSSWMANHTCYLQDLFTVPESRGKGVGRALIEAVCDAARTAGSTRVYWTTHETNAEAQVLYNKVAERSGFIQYRRAL